MKKIMVGFVWMLCITPTFAQTGDGEARQGERSPWYLMPQISGNHNLTENSRFRDFQMGMGFSVTAGREFTRVLGYRATLGYNQNKAWSSWKEDAVSTCFSNIDLSVDGTLDFTDWWFPRRSAQRFNLKGLLGVGYMHTFGHGDDVLAIYEPNYSTDSKAVFGVRGGLNASVRVKQNLAIALEATLAIMPDKFNGVINGTNADGRVNVGIGCIWYLSPKKKTQQTPQPESRITTVQPEPVVALPVEPIVPVVVTPPPVVRIDTVPPVVKNDTVPAIDRSFPPVYFRQGSAVLEPDFRQNWRPMDELTVLARKARIDSKGKKLRIHIIGFVSPEGNVQLNTRLANQRAVALAAYLAKQTGIPSEQFTLSNGGTDRTLPTYADMRNATIVKIVFE
ncbi:MAG: OmpA family protein [Prevotellaceae bacterium]|jgi:outer membrane protein OmpA-like peptidoglycan-associated protein|nr:OmpA family protein [Prevotellaceae bacterium]